MPEDIRLLQLAKRFLAASRDLASQGGPGHRFPVPHYLAAHAVELALKAHLAHRGTTEAQLKRIKHDLEEALRLSDASVHAVLTSGQETAIEWINPFYKGKELEYTAWGASGRLLSVPDVSYLVGAAVALTHYLDTRFRADLRLQQRRQKP